MADIEELEFFVQPYQFEPPARRDQFNNNDSSENDSSSSSDASEAEGQLHDVTYWCSCGHCLQMQVPRDRKCCKDCLQCVEKMGQRSCICQHEGFLAKCLNPHVLEVSFYEYIEQQGPVGDDEPIHEVYRYIAYRRFTRWIWHILGKKNRKVIPSCVVNKIRETFPSSSETYTGFKYPDDY
ncbi:P2X purinoceptor 7-like [Patella vulgata]|uniref:P2X purinoceptor 7-like n=1 Tax=Patella vulgata TaxID=6465 RepID=UPI0024A93380|nr:P2X purinoceptor 7-like [Patella vulgata]